MHTNNSVVKEHDGNLLLHGSEKNTHTQTHHVYVFVSIHTHRENNKGNMASVKTDGELG